MTNIRHRVTATALSVFGVIAFFYAFQMIGCIASARAEPAVAGDWHAPASALADSAVTWLLAALVILKVLDMALARIAPLTRNTWDDALAQRVHELHTTADEILAHVKPGGVTSGTIEHKDGAS